MWTYVVCRHDLWRKLVFVYLFLVCSYQYCGSVYSLSVPPKNGKVNKQQQDTFYNYFAFGSNMASSTMRNLRKLNPIAETAAILPQYELVFSIPGTPLMEPSWAAVRPTEDDTSVVHGVLYRLTEEDFVKVCQTEGVPFAYRLKRCQVIPYVGDGINAGETRRLSGQSSSSSSKTVVRAITLVDANEDNNKQNIPPSQSYLNVLLRGAKEFGLDRNYVQYLESIECGKTIVGNGVAERMLQFAEITSNNDKDKKS